MPYEPWDPSKDPYSMDLVALNSYFSVAKLKEILPDPREIVKELDKHIIGQTKAKEVLALAAFNRSLRKLQRHNKIEGENLPLPKTNVLLIGPTGCGKTGLVRALSEVMGISITIADVSCVSASGYVGGSIDSIIQRYTTETLKNLTEFEDGFLVGNITSHNQLVQEAMETGILYLDEIDKLRRYDINEHDVSGTEVQYEILRLLEGDGVDYSAGHGNRQHDSTLDFSDITLILGGAFVGLEDIIRRRLAKDSGIGFTANPRFKELKDEDMLQFLTSDDLIEFGIIPELIGRIPLIATLAPLNKNILKEILNKPKNSLIEQYKQFFGIFNLELEFSDSVLDKVAEIAIKRETGARGLNSIMSELMQPYKLKLFDYKSDEKIIVYAEHLNEK